MRPRSKEETEAIFDEILVQINEGMDELEARGDFNDGRDRACASVSPEGEGQNGIVFSVMNGTTSEQERIESEEVASLEPQSTRKSRGSKRFKSPFKSRQAFGNKSDSKARKLKEKQVLQRKMSLPDVHINMTAHKPLTRGISTDIVPTTTPSSSMASLDTLQLIHQYHSYKEPARGISVSPQRAPVNPDNFVNSHAGRGRSDPVANALRLMVTLSSNKECHHTLISYICLPKCVSR